MDFFDLYERLLKIIVERVRSGKTSAAKLSRQTGLTPAHLSNVLRGKRGVSLKTLNAMLEAALLQVEDLLLWSRVPRRTRDPKTIIDSPTVPIVATDAVMLHRQIRPEQTVGKVKWGDGSMSGLRQSCSVLRKDWDRFIGIRVSEEQAASTRPKLEVGATAFIDRHYTLPTSSSQDRSTLFAVFMQGRLHFRYVHRIGNFLIVNALDPAVNPRMIEIKAPGTTEELIVGRVVQIVIPG